MRSKLFVPASRPELFSKALASSADAVSFDLEDAVAESRKEEARENLRAFLQSAEAIESNKMFIVRVNPSDTPHFQADIAAVLVPRLDLLNLPKVSSAREVHETAVIMREIEARNNVPEPIRLLLNIETPAAIHNAFELAAAHPRVAGLQLGFADLFEPLGIARTNRAAIEAAMFEIRMAAGAAGIFVCDAAFANTADTGGFRAEAQRARDFGLIGKSCIHPSQVVLANEVFRPTDEEIAHALKVVASIAHANANGIGAYLIDGRMIDAPFIRRAQEIVADARQLGLVGAGPTKQ
jgi:citrate lyase subunit beta/citryl-CoA lyase